MQTFDPELAALMVAPPAPSSDGPPHVPTVAEMRAFFNQHVVAPFKAYQEPLLPAGECFYNIWWNIWLMIT